MNNGIKLQKNYIEEIKKMEQGIKKRTKEVFVKLNTYYLIN